MLRMMPLSSTPKRLSMVSRSTRTVKGEILSTQEITLLHRILSSVQIVCLSPRNRGIELTSLAVTGWKAMYVNKGFFGRIDGVSRDESDIIAKYCFDLINNNMDIQCRFRWEAGSIAIWDNRCTWHSGMSFLPSIGPITDCTALFDYNEERAGDRASSIGEKPYLDPNSQYKSEALKAEGKKW
jgi:hypothetical protein